jgi:secondary thiamine-phosphate synthase enzyme
MAVFGRTIERETTGFADIHDLTEDVAAVVAESSIGAGVVTVFVPGSTGAVTTVEHEPGLLRDLPEFFDRLVPRDREYHHDATWGDGNGFSHVRAALTGPSLAVPFNDGVMTLGAWQQTAKKKSRRPARRRIGATPARFRREPAGCR